MPACRCCPSRFLLACCLILAFSPLSRTQTAAITGTVSDATGAAIPGATLRVFGPEGILRAVRSDGSGAFSVADLPPGTYLVEFAAPGFQKLSRRLRLDLQPVTVAVRLEIGGLHQHVSVVASDRPEVAAEIAKSVAMIGPEELAERNSIFLSDALSSVPALQLQQLGGPGRLASYRFRGLRPEDAGIFLDGFRFQDPADNRRSTRPFLSDLLLTGADRIEVLRGAGSTLYGSNAIGGLINVISSQPTRPLAGYLAAEGGSLGLAQSLAGIQGGKQRAWMALDFAHVDYLRGPDGHDNYRITSGTTRSGLRLTPHWSLFAKFSMSDSAALLDQDPAPLLALPPLPPGENVRRAVPFPHPGATFYPQIDDPDYRQQNRIVQGALRLEHQWNPVWSQSFGYQSLRTKRFYHDGPGLSPLAASLGYDQLFVAGPRRYHGELDELYWRHQFALGRFDSLQAQFGWERTALDQTEFGQTTQAAQKAFSIQLQNQWRLLQSRLHVGVAAQAQFYRLDQPVFTDDIGNPYRDATAIDPPASYNGDASLAYLFASSRTKLRIHAGNGYRAPSLYERFGSGGSGFYFGNPELRPERSLFADAGVEQYFLGDRWQASATYFYTRLQTIIDFGATPDDSYNRFFGYLNRRGGLARGVELSLAARPGARFQFNASYTFTNSDQPAATSADTTRALGLADHQFTLGVSLQPASRWNLHVQTYAVSSHDFPLFGALFPFPFGTFRFPGYVRADLSAGYVLHESERSRLRLTMRLDNLLNREYYHGGFRAPKAVARTGLRWEF